MTIGGMKIFQGLFGKNENRYTGDLADISKTGSILFDRATSDNFIEHRYVSLERILHISYVLPNR